MQILVVGRISQAAILAAAAYKNHDTFKRQTGITKSRLIYDREHHDTKVGHMSPNWSPGLLQQQPVSLALFSTFLLNLVFLCPFAGVQLHVGWLIAQQSLMSWALTTGYVAIPCVVCRCMWGGWRAAQQSLLSGALQASKTACRMSRSSVAT